MATIRLPPGFKEFLKLLKDHNVRSLLIEEYLEITTSISGVKFDSYYQGRVVAKLDGIEVNLINLKDLKTNKKASGRLKDLTDLEKLP
jgi:hypothetical protein